MTTPSPAAPTSPGSATHAVRLRVNDTEHALQIEPRRTLLDALRADLHLTGTKKVCDMGDCGACTVLLEGKAVYSCLVLAADCDRRPVTTVEGLARDGQLDPVQRAFVEMDAFQCGFCTPGQIVSIRALLDENPQPTDEEIHRAVSGNLCRCGAYLNIVRAGKRAAELAAQERATQGAGR
jgi:xanthine dehydrogenase YagT iron-sulfur-binding subunit